MTSISFSNKVVTHDSPTYFIADIAANHDGDLERAKHLIALAKEFGADAAKFQNFKAASIVSNRGFLDLGQKLDHQASWNKSVFEVYDQASIPDQWATELFNFCKEIDIEFMSTPYDFESVDLLDKYVNVFKIGSGDISWLEAIEYITQKKKPVILATGASTIDDVDHAVNVLIKSQVPFCLMQCNTNYTGNPDNINFVNLNVLNQYKERYPMALLGLSDHTHGHESVLGAIALGARIIEKHFTDDITRYGPDHKFSMTPETWNRMVTATRELEKALGDGIKKIENNEKETVIVQRRSIRASRDINAGETIDRESISLLRPCPDDAIAASSLELVIGKKAKYDIKFDSSINFNNIE